LLVPRRHWRGFRVAPSQASVSDYGKEGKLEFTVCSDLQVSITVVELCNFILPVHAITDHSD
jgi:hypothetical protein